MKKYSMLSKLTGCILTATSLAMMGLSLNAMKAPKMKLNNNERIVELLEFFDADPTYATKTFEGANTLDDLLSSKFYRYEAKKDKSIKFLLSDDFSEKDINNINIAVDELNRVFDVINNNYNFEVVLNATIKDKLDPSNISINMKDLSSLNYAGYYQESGNGNFPNIFIAADESNSSSIISTFLHEAMHMLGLGDAYTIDGASQRTIMSKNSTYDTLLKNDLKVLASLYSNETDPVKLNDIKEFIDTYEDKYSQWYRINVKSIFVRAKKKLTASKIETALVGKYGVVVEDALTTTFKDGFTFEYCDKENYTYVTKDKRLYVQSKYSSRKIVTIDGDFVNIKELRFYANDEKSCEIVEYREPCENVDGSIMLNDGSLIAMMDGKVALFDSKCYVVKNIGEKVNAKSAIQTLEAECALFNETLDKQCENLNYIATKTINTITNTMSAEVISQYIEKNCDNVEELISLLGEPKEIQNNLCLVKDKKNYSSIMNCVQLSGNSINYFSFDGSQVMNSYKNDCITTNYAIVTDESIIMRYGDLYVAFYNDFNPETGDVTISKIEIYSNANLMNLNNPGLFVAQNQLVKQL